MFRDKTNDRKIQQAIYIAQDFLENHLSIIKKETHFTYTKMTVSQVYETIKDRIRRGTYSEIHLYTSKWPWSKAVAYTTSGSSKIFINTSKLPERTIADYVNTLTHEYLHLCGFSHGSNSPKGKEQSVPYRIGQLAENYAKLFT
jgi:hypothetical protein